MEVINLKRLCAVAKIPYHKVYHWASGRYDKAPTKQMKVQLANALVSTLKPFLDEIGYDIKISSKS